MNNESWYAVYTRGNAEKKFLERLSAKSIEAYLPMRQVTKVWSDRKKKIDEPLFKSYVFVRSTLEGLHRVKHIPGFSYFVSFGGYPVAIPDNLINEIKSILQHHWDADSIASKLVKGDHIKVINGPLKGMSGVLTEIKGKKLVAVEVTDLEQSMLISIPVEHLIKIGE